MLTRNADLFAEAPPAVEMIATDVILLRGFASPTARLVAAIERIAARAPFRHLVTPGGGQMSVAMTNCGAWGWHSDRRGYRYVSADPQSANPWPRMPPRFRQLAAAATEVAGFGDSSADACLVNRYVPGARMGAHRDCDERDLTRPIVSVSIGLPAVFLWYGPKRSGSPRRVRLKDGDVLVWGRSARTHYHGVRRLDDGEHPVTGGVRYNLTFRTAR